MTFAGEAALLFRIPNPVDRLFHRLTTNWFTDRCQNLPLMSLSN